MKKSKLFAPFLMLLAGAVVSLTMFLFHYSAGETLPVLLGVLIVFYLIGSLVQMKINSFISQINEAKAKEEEEAAARERERLASLENEAQEDAESKDGEGQA